MHLPVGFLTSRTILVLDILATLWREFPCVERPDGQHKPSSEGDDSASLQPVLVSARARTHTHTTHTHTHTPPLFLTEIATAACLFISS